MGEQHRQRRLPFQDAHGDFEFYARDLPLCAPLLYPSASAREAIQQLPLEPALQRTALQQERRHARFDFGLDEVRNERLLPAYGSASLAASDQSYSLDLPPLTIGAHHLSSVPSISTQLEQSRNFDARHDGIASQSSPVKAPRWERSDMSAVILSPTASPEKRKKSRVWRRKRDLILPASTRKRNREAQQRFREKQKERKLEISNELEHLRAENEALNARVAELEALVAAKETSDDSSSGEGRRGIDDRGRQH